MAVELDVRHEHMFAHGVDGLAHATQSVRVIHCPSSPREVAASSRWERCWICASALKLTGPPVRSKLIAGRVGAGRQDARLHRAVLVDPPAQRPLGRRRRRRAAMAFSSPRAADEVPRVGQIEVAGDLVAALALTGVARQQTGHLLDRRREIARAGEGSRRDHAQVDRSSRLVVLDRVGLLTIARQPEHACR